LSQPMFVTEIFTDRPGRYVKVEDTVRGTKAILDGECDDIPEPFFYMVGGIEDVFESAARGRRLQQCRT
jgi:F-type H+-transporting ATPase subunit beta